MKFSIHGPFEIPRKYSKKPSNRIDNSNEAKKNFWEQCNKKTEGLSFACGCYIFGTSASGGNKPWYVGKASGQSFVQECFNSHKIVIYNEVISEHKGTPILFLIAKHTRGGKFCKPSNNKQSDISYLETLLIDSAREKNSKLKNIKKTKQSAEMKVLLLINTLKKQKII